MAEVAAVAEQWLHETVDEYGQILPQVTESLTAQLAGASAPIDPWQKSRQMTQALWEKWGKQVQG